MFKKTTFNPNRQQIFLSAFRTELPIQKESLMENAKMNLSEDNNKKQKKHPIEAQFNMNEPKRLKYQKN
jgi:hypothetical protein